MSSYCINPARTKVNCTGWGCSGLKNCILCSETCANEYIDHISKKSHCSTSLLISGYDFDDKQLDPIIHKIFEDTYSTYMLINRKPNLKQSIRKQALKVVSSSTFYSKRLMTSKDINFDEKMDLVENSNYQPSLVNSYLKESMKKDQKRLGLIEKFENPDELFTLACNGYLSTVEKALLHKKFSPYYFNKFKRNFRTYYLYCKVFHKQIHNHEKELLYQKLVDRKHYDCVEEALKLFKFQRLEQEKLESIHIAMILSR